MVGKTPTPGGNLWGCQGHAPTAELWAPTMSLGCNTAGSGGNSDPQGNAQATRNTISSCSIHSWRKMLELRGAPSPPLPEEIPQDLLHTTQG